MDTMDGYATGVLGDKPVKNVAREKLPNEDITHYHAHRDLEGAYDPECRLLRPNVNRTIPCCECKRSAHHDSRVPRDPSRCILWTLLYRGPSAHIRSCADNKKSSPGTTVISFRFIKYSES